MCGLVRDAFYSDRNGVGFCCCAEVILVRRLRQMVVVIVGIELELEAVMRTFVSALALAIPVAFALGAASSANAQLAVVCPTCSSIWTQLAGYAMQGDSLAKQALQYQNQILQYQAMLKHLQDNPLGVVLPNLTLLATNTAKIKANGINLANNMSNVAGNIEKAFKNPQGDFGVKFKVWTTASRDALEGAMLNAGLHREQFADDTAAVEALIRKNQASEGDLGALKTLGEFNAAQLNESIKLRDLITSQNEAINTAMLAQVSKNGSDQERFQAISGPKLMDVPRASSNKEFIALDIFKNRDGK